MKRLYHPATPCNGSLEKELSLDVLLDSKNLEIVPASEGFQIFTEGYKGYWVRDLNDITKFCDSHKIKHKVFNRDAKISGSSWFSYTPIELELEVTRACNQECEHCYNKSHFPLPNELRFDEIQRLLDGFRSSGGQKLKITGGEPLMRKDLFDIMEYAQHVGIKSYEFTSNGNLINKDNAQKLRQYLKSVNISIFGNKEVHDKITNSSNSFDRAINALGILKEEGIGVNIFFTVMKDNVSQIPYMVEFASDHDLPIRFSLVRNVGRGESIPAVTSEGVSLISSYLKQETEDKKLKIVRSELYTREYSQDNLGGHKFYGCNGARSLIYCDSEGNFFPCSLNSTLLGNFRQSSLLGVWSDEPATKFRNVSCDCSYIKECGGKWLCGGPCKIQCF